MSLPGPTMGLYEQKKSNGMMKYDDYLDNNTEQHNGEALLTDYSSSDDTKLLVEDRDFSSNTMNIEKRRLKQEKLNEAFNQTKKVEKAILLSEQRELELRNEKQRESELERNKLKDMNQEVDTVKQQIEDIKAETDELSHRLHLEMKGQKELMQQLEHRKNVLIRELDSVLNGYQKDVKIKMNNKLEYENEIEELTKKVDILGKKEEEKKEEVKAKQYEIEKLKQQEESCLKRLDEFSVEDMSSEVKAYMLKLTSYQKEKTDLVLELERHKANYPLEVALIEKQEEYDAMTARFVKEKEEYINRRKKAQENIDELHKELRSKEDENEQLRSEFNQIKRREEEEISREKNHIESLKRQFELKIADLKKMELVYDRAREMYDQFTDSQKLALRLIDHDITVLNEEMNHFEEEKDIGLRNLQQELFAAIGEAIHEEEAFENSTPGLAQCFESVSIPAEVIMNMQEIRSRQALSTNESFRHDQELIELYKQNIYEIGQKENDLDSLKDTGSLEEIERKKKELEELQQNLYHSYRTKLHTNRERLIQRHQSVELLESDRAIDNLRYDILETVAPYLKDKIEIIEQKADIVVNKRLRISKFIEAYERKMFDISFQKEILVHWRKILEEERDNILGKMKTGDEAMIPYLSGLEEKMDAMHQHIQRLADSFSDTSSITEREVELKKKIDAERQRLSSFSQYVSYVEEKINALSVEKRRAEQGWDAVVAHEKDYETISQEERSTIQDALAQQYRQQSQLEVAEAGDRLATFTRMIRKIKHVTAIVEKTRIQSESNGTGELVQEAMSKQQKVQQETTEIHLAALAAREDLENLISEVTVITKERRRLDEQLQNLILEEKHSGNIQEKEIKFKETKREELERTIAEIDRQEFVQQEEHDSSVIPIKQHIEENRREMLRLSKILQNKKRDLASMKNHVDAIEARYTSEISRIRGQRQLLRHRLDLKMKAIDNIQNTDPVLTTMSLAHSGKQAAAKNERLKTSGKKSQGEDNTYFKMYIKKKDPDLEGKDTFQSYDQELHDALLNSQQSSPDRTKTMEEKEQVAPKQATYPVTSNTERNPNSIEFAIGENISKKANIRLFGPQTKPLTEKEAQTVIERIEFMCNGSLLHKKKDKKATQSGNTITKNNYDVRHVSLSQELTRLQIRDQKKKVPESFVKVEHIIKLQVAPARYSTDGYIFSLILSSKKMDFLTFDEDDYNAWVEGLSILIENKQHLFSLKYNIRDIVNTADIH